jgi:hypothetical protein|tara:strand:+ start:2960 stop:3160 length:201 start_codon:yes stop_codon:yes gene_type:complete
MEWLSNLDTATIIWSVIAIFEVLVRLTPSTKDNSILNKVIWVVEKFIPNKSKGNDKDKFKLFKKNK